MKLKLLFALLFVCAFSSAQIRFTKGYFITNSGDKNEVLIRDLDWIANPDSFQFKLSEADEVKTATIKDVQEFRTSSGDRYVRADVQIDRSSQRLSDLTYKPEPDYKRETVFLKELVAGKARLFKYSDGGINRYFYQMNDGEITVLIYKPYLVSNDQVAYNMDFQKQLKESFTCKTDTQSSFTNLRHEEKALVNLFLAQNRCLDPDFVEAEKTKTKQFNVNIRPRVNFSSFTAQNAGYNVDTDFGSQTTFGLGLELEYFLPFGKSRWALIAEPNYRYYKSSLTQFRNDSYIFTPIDSTVDYKTIELPFGIRYYLHLSPKSKLFVNALYVFDIPVGADASITSGTSLLLSTDFEGGVEPAAGFGLGYSFNNKFGAEFRVFTDRSFFPENRGYTSNFKNTSFILSYNLF
jgi:hypothetical protein